MSTTCRRNDWIDATEACRVIDLPHPRNLDRLVAEGLLVKRTMPGTRLLYSRASAQTLVRESVNRAAV